MFASVRLGERQLYALSLFGQARQKQQSMRAALVTIVLAG